MKSTITTIVMITTLCWSTAAISQQKQLSTKEPLSELSDDNEKGMLDLYGIIPENSSIVRYGWGGGLNMFSRPFALGQKVNPRRLEVRFGGGLNVVSLMKNTLYNVPLAAPQSGYAKVKLRNILFSFNAIVRFSQPVSNKVVPFLDVFTGFRNFGASMNVRPNTPQTEQGQDSPQSIPSLTQFHYGATAGILVSLNKTVKLNASVSISQSPKEGTVLGVKTAHLESDAVVMSDVTVNRRFITANLGFTFLIDFKRGQCDRQCGDERRPGRWGNTTTTTIGGSGGGGNHSHINMGTARPSK